MILEHADGAPTLVLEPEQSWGLLEPGRFGRLVVVLGQRADVFPINYAAAPDRTLIFRTAPGTKLAKLAINAEVLFEADQVSTDTAWTVTVRGQAHWLQTSSEIEAAEELQLRPWVPTLKDNYVRVTPTEISGRHFQLSPHPARELGEAPATG
ncbi:flavin-nucleotide-binding protein [Nesterenkonia sp. AN1]|uniref:Nitroimidazol reductase NimA-like FMN-containing flavoprotein (Pyridoxamine 5'-phosphate oxidase superfamily) n=1 Tax=Nesterenkonia aurantiaca TaxID=1436010 RepID=A0A4R7G0V0_9MICC|nr:MULTISPECIES: pyridoxamine 5'-phosphate oxidase family protein [Nesterenkonia]EXF24959.1 flavin-nucleotide-binding protein [Nesterenkonia sp. AN1]TDS84737.1 nitroimidazol reductase NimA-like FMN-containing flavoprotein (pyridoxamine 5'-phosphate oxidase superfamily) [Nesterenkonia aurantiaca]